MNHRKISVGEDIYEDGERYRITGIVAGEVWAGNKKMKPVITKNCFTHGWELQFSISTSFSTNYSDPDQLQYWICVKCGDRKEVKRRGQDSQYEGQLVLVGVAFIIFLAILASAFV